MKSFQSLSATLLLIIVFVACSNDASTKEAAGTTDTSCSSDSIPQIQMINSKNSKQIKRL